MLCFLVILSLHLPINTVQSFSGALNSSLSRFLFITVTPCCKFSIIEGEETGHGGIGLMVKHDLVESVMEVRRVSPRIISIDIVVNKKVVTVISVYAPQSGRSEEEKEKFYEDLTAEVQSRHSICFV